MSRVTAAVVQVGSYLFDTPRTLAKAHDVIADAARGGARIVVLPEAYLGGIPRGSPSG